MNGSLDLSIEQEVVDKLSRKTLFVREERMKLAIRDKPKWLPDRLHKWVLSKMLVLECFQ